MNACVEKIRFKYCYDYCHVQLICITLHLSNNDSLDHCYMNVTGNIDQPQCNKPFSDENSQSNDS